MDPLIAFVNWTDGSFEAPGRRSSEKKLGQLKGIFRDQLALEKADPETIVYRVSWWEPVPPATEGGLFWGVTQIEPGRVGDEYYMTRGHRHQVRNRAEFYGTVSGKGVLVLRDSSGVRAEEMAPGSLHYIHGDVAHRVVNTGEAPLRFVACWPSDAGHDYDLGDGFGARILERGGIAVFTNTHE